ncbi:MAG TPA: DUF1579 family protein [Puia sp.]|nr:DUF1579 family protein [Puia sp.]
MKSTLVLIILASFFGTSTFAQNDEFKQLLAYSAPGKNHALIGTLSGSWTFQDQQRSFVKGTVLRKAMYEGRFYTVEVTGGKLQIPVADGKMKEANYQGMQIEGYDNAKMRFVTISLNNHIGSDLEMQMGTYDSTTRTFTYEGETELLPGTITKNRRTLKIIDNDHYTEEYFELKNDVATKTRELRYTRAKE